MATATNLLVGAVLPLGTRAGGLADRVGECHQVVAARPGRVEFPVVAHEVPSTGGRQPTRVKLAQIVRMGLGERGERPDDSGGIGVDVGQRRDRGSGATVAGAAPW